MISTTVGEGQRIHTGCSLRFLPPLVKESVYTLDVRNRVLGEEMRKHVGCSLQFLPPLVKESVYTLDVRKLLHPISMSWRKQMFGCTPV